MIVDASVILGAFVPDEQQTEAQALIRDHVIGRLQLVAPNLLLYEATNAVAQARRRGRIRDKPVADILSSFDGLGIARGRCCMRVGAAESNWRSAALPGGAGEGIRLATPGRATEVATTNLSRSVKPSTS